MWNPFRQKPVLTAEDQLFQVECFKWLLMHFGGDDFYKDTQLVLPTREFFPSVVQSSDAAAHETFAQVKKHVGMEDWPVTLEAQAHDVEPLVSPTVVLQNLENSPAGTFSVDETHAVTITYNPKITADPIEMVATFAHELSHYLTEGAEQPPPGGWDNWEFATDICATFLGFGVFQANAAFRFRQYSGNGVIGWGTTSGGYLLQAEHSYALAIFLRLKNIEPREALPFCDDNVKGYLKAALRELDRSPVIAELSAVPTWPSTGSKR